MLRYFFVAFLALTAFSTDALGWYSPTTGTFVQRDPAGYRDGMNLYRYGAANPTRFVDPMGLASTPHVPPAGWPDGYPLPDDYEPSWDWRPNPHYDPNYDPMTDPDWEKPPQRHKPGTLRAPDQRRWSPHPPDPKHPDPHIDYEPPKKPGQPKPVKIRIPVSPRPSIRPPGPSVGPGKPGKIGWLGTASCIAACAQDYDNCLGTANSAYDRCVNTAIGMRCASESEAYGKLCGRIFALDAGICVTEAAACKLQCLLPF